MKKAFSLLELIFAIVIIGIIASFAVPKYIDTKNHALATVIRNDIITSITSIQSYYLLNRKIDKITDAIKVNSSNWEISDKSMIFKDSKDTCIDFSIVNNQISITISKDTSSVCTILDSMGIETEVIDLL